MLGGVDAKSGDANTGQIVEVGREPVPDMIEAGVQVREPDQVAVLHHPAVMVGAADVATRLVEVLRHIVRILIVIERAAGAAEAPQRIIAVARPGHVVNDRIHVDLDAGIRAAANHVLERRAITAATA